MVHMACIGCGLGLNADGTGRVDIDTSGGLKCTGTAGGASNTSGRGLAVKKATTAGNSLVVDGNGLFVPASYRAENFAYIISGTNLTGPNNGTPVNSPECVVSVSNTSALPKTFNWQVSVDWGTSDADPGIGFKISSRVDGGAWFLPVQYALPVATVVSPAASRVFSHTIPAGQTSTFRSVFQVYVGFVSEYSLQIIGWGGYS